MSNCSGVVAMSVFDTDLYTDESACGLFVVADGGIQPFDSTRTIDWERFVFSAPVRNVSVLPIPADVAPKKAIVTTACRALSCGSVADSRCEPCRLAHRGAAV